MGTNKKSMALPAVVFAIIFLVYNVALFVIAGFEDHESSFWISYAFVIAAFISTAITGLVLNARDLRAKDWIFGYPIIKHCINYCIVEFILSVIFMLIDEWEINWAVPFIIQLLVFAVYIVFLLSSFIAKNTIETVEKNVKVSTSYMKFLRVEADTLVSMATDPVAKQTVTKLAEAIRYSDPVSNPALADLERQIALKLSDAKTLIKYNDTEKLLTCCKEAELLLQERNQKCMILK